MWTLGTIGSKCINSLRHVIIVLDRRDYANDSSPVTLTVLGGAAMMTRSTTLLRSLNKEPELHLPANSPRTTAVTHPDKISRDTTRQNSQLPD